MRVLLPLLSLVVLAPGCDLAGPSLAVGEFEGEGVVSVFQPGGVDTRPVALAGAASFRLERTADGTVRGTEIVLSDRSGEGRVFFGDGWDGSDARERYYLAERTYAIDGATYSGFHNPGGLHLVPLGGTLTVTAVTDDEVAGRFEGTGDSRGWSLAFRARVIPETVD